MLRTMVFHNIQLKFNVDIKRIIASTTHVILIQPLVGFNLDELIQSKHLIKKVYGHVKNLHIQKFYVK